MYQKTIVRYELNDRKYKVDDSTNDFYDKWQFPCFLGVDDNNNFIWYNCDFGTIVKNGDVHKLFYFSYDSYNPQIELWVRKIVNNLMNLGLVVRNENGKTYKYIFEGYKFEKLIIKEIMGIEVESFKDLETEQWQFLEKQLGDIWKKEAELFQNNENHFVDFGGILN
jgi:hypothetical protein